MKEPEKLTTQKLEELISDIFFKQESMIIKEGIRINGIYQHYKGDFYLVKDVAYHHEGGLFHLDDVLVIYTKCDKNGIYISIRDNEGEVTQPQPFYRQVSDFITEVRHPLTQEFIKRFRYIKQV